MKYVFHILQISKNDLRKTNFTVCIVHVVQMLKWKMNIAHIYGECGSTYAMRQGWQIYI